MSYEMNAVAKNIVSDIFTLCAVESPSGMTRACSDLVADMVEKMGFAVTRTRKGGVIACLGGEGAPVALCSHVDTLGMVVSAVKPNGRLKFSHIGGFTENSVENENVRIHTRDGRVYEGTVQSIYASKHVFSDKAGAERNEDNVEIVIDEITHSAAETRALGIRNGDVVTADPRTRLAGSGFIKSRHLDDKASAAVLLELARRVSVGEVKPLRKTYIIFTVYEEVGHGASSGLPEDVEDMLVVDMGCVGGDLEGDETKVSIDAKDGGGPYDYEMTSELIRLADKLQLHYAVDVFKFYSSDTATALKAGRDVRHALIGPGVFASHGYERTHVQALLDTLSLVEGYITTEAQA